MSLFGDLGAMSEVDRGVRLRLAQSLDYLARKAKDHLQVDWERFDAALVAIRERRQHPGVFARYYDLISALTSGRFEDAKTLFEDIERLATGETVRFEIAPYTEERLGSDFERFPRLIFAEFAAGNPMASPTAAQAEASTRALNEAIAIIAEVDPTIREEIESLLVRIYLAKPNRDPSVRGFGGVTSFMAWGASFINIDFYRTRWDAVQFLVHEITHGLLFGLSFEEPLVLNAPSEAYKSPLRADPRPMDGIFHATLVCGRLAGFNRAWLESGVVDETDRAQCERAVVSNRQLFQDGAAVIVQHGKLSEQARRLVDVSDRALAATS